MAQPTVARIERRTLAMKVEASYGVDVFAGTVAAADIMEVFNINVTAGPQTVDVPGLGAQLGSLGAVAGVRTAQVTFEQWARGAGAAYSASVKPNADLPLRGCGLSATGSFVLNLEKWTYVPRSSAFESMTIYVMQENAPTMKLAGAFGDCQLIFQNGRPLIIRYTFTGVYIVEADTPALVTKVFAAAPQWPVMLSSLFQIGTENFAAAHSQIQWNLANVLDVREAPTDASGISAVLIAARRPNGTIDPEQVTIASFPWITKWQDAVQMDMSFDSNGAQYARWKASAPKAQIRTRGWSTRGQKATYQIAFDLAFSVGDDEMSLVFD